MHFAALFLALLALAGSAQAATYPISARLLMSDEARAFCKVEGAHDECAAPVGQQVQEALESAVRRMFVAPLQGQYPDLLLGAKVRTAGLQGGSAIITMTVQISSPAGSEIDTLSVRGDAIALETDAQSLPGLFARSARDAADNFERDFANSEPVVRWLAARNITPVGSEIVGPARAALALFLDGGGEAVSVPDGTGPGIRAGMGVTGKWFLLRGTFAHWTSDLSTGGLKTTEWGIEGGPVWRPTRNWEVRAGGGVQFASGSVGDQEFSTTMPSLFAGVQYAAWPGGPGPMRVRFALEFHTHFDTAVTFPGFQPIDVAGPSVGLFVGIEVPIIPSREPLGGK